MRRDIVELVKKAVGENRRTYALVNNRSEGNALDNPCSTECVAGCGDVSVPIFICVCPASRNGRLPIGE